MFDAYGSRAESMRKTERQSVLNTPLSAFNPICFETLFFL